MIKSVNIKSGSFFFNSKMFHLNENVCKVKCWRLDDSGPIFDLLSRYFLISIFFLFPCFFFFFFFHNKWYASSSIITRQSSLDMEEIRSNSISRIYTLSKEEFKGALNKEKFTGLIVLKLFWGEIKFLLLSVFCFDKCVFLLVFRICRKWAITL